MPYTPENNPYIPGDPYSYDLKWIIARIKEISNKEGANAAEIAELKTIIESIINDPHYPMEEVQEVLQEMYDAGLFDLILSRILKEFEFDQPALMSEYGTLDEYFNELDALAGDSSWLSSITLDTTGAGNPIKCYVIGKPGLNGNYYRNGLIFANQHAREYQGTFVLVNAVKMIVENLENGTGSVHGIDFADMFTGYRLFIVPTGNPDGYKLTMEDSYFDLPAATQSSIASMVEWYIRNGYIDTVSWNDYTPDEYAQLLSDFGGDLTTYTFRPEDIVHVWKANLDGIDLHYNSFNASTAAVVSAWSISQGWPQQAAPQGYIGTSGFETIEGSALKTLISTYGITSVLDLHQRGPTMFFAYKFGGIKFARNLYISQKIANATVTPVNSGNNGQVGFIGWYHNQYTGDDYYGAIKEIGWSSREQFVNGASAPRSVAPTDFLAYPLPRDMSPLVYNREINGILEFVSQAVNNMAINQFKMNTNNPDYATANPGNLADEKIIVDKDFFHKYGLTKITLLSTNETLTSLVTSYVDDYDIILLWNKSDDNAPNILMPGLYTQGKLIVSKRGTLCFARFYAVTGDIWECVITSSTSTPWQLITPYAKRDYKTCSVSGNEYTVADIDGNDLHLYFEPAMVVSAEAETVTTKITRQPVGSPTQYYTFKIKAFNPTTISSGIYYMITAKPYPSHA